MNELRNFRKISSPSFVRLNLIKNANPTSEENCLSTGVRSRSLDACSSSLKQLRPHIRQSIVLSIATRFHRRTYGEVCESQECAESEEISGKTGHIKAKLETECGSMIVPK